MTLDILCYKCHEPLEEPGAIMTSPPSSDFVGNISHSVRHLCKYCYYDTVVWMRKDNLEKGIDKQ